MALLFMDGFDHYATADLFLKWSSSVQNGGNQLVVDPAGGRRGSGSFRWANGFNSGGAVAAIIKGVVSASPTCVLGFAIQIPTGLLSATAPLPIAVVLDGSSTQVALSVRNDGAIVVSRGSPALGNVLGTTTSGLVTAGVYAYIELKTLIDPSAGTVIVRVNGATVLNLTAQNTRNTANSSWSAIALGVYDTVNSSYVGGTQQTNYDDVYLLDGSGAAPLNNLLGDCRVDARVPTGAGATTGWTPSTAPNWGCVDEMPPNGDTDYVTAATAGLKDTYAVQDVAVPGAQIYGVQLLWNLKKLDAGVCSVAPVVRHAGTDNVGTAQNPSTNYAYQSQVYPTNPGTSAAWVEADFNAAEFGVSRTA